MRLYLLRHGQARESWEDPERPLSESGRAQVEAVSRAALRRGFSPVLCYSSPKLRARESASLLLSVLSPGPALEESRRLLPNDPVTPWVSRLADAEEDTLLVGHNPFMENLSAALLGYGALPFGTATLVCLERGPEGRWRFLWSEEPPEEPGPQD